MSECCKSHHNSTSHLHIICALCWKIVFINIADISSIIQTDEPLPKCYFFWTEVWHLRLINTDWTVIWTPLYDMCWENLYCRDICEREKKNPIISQFATSFVRRVMFLYGLLAYEWEESGIYDVSKGDENWWERLLRAIYCETYLHHDIPFFNVNNS